MEKQIITFSASEQTLTKTGGIDHYASNTVSYVQAVFDLGENWAGFDSVRAVFKTPYKTKPAVLDHSGRCLVPFEVLKYKCKVFVNLVGSISEEGVLTDRLTSYPIEALTIDANASVDNSETAISPTEFEEFVAIVSDDADRAEAGATASEASADSAEASAESALASAQTAQEEAQKITGMVVVVTQLPEGATPTSDWSNGVLTIGIPKGDTGETGATGNGIESAVLNANYTLTLTFTDGTSYTTPSIRGATGATGATGNGISSVTLTSTSGAVKTYTIAFTDGTNTTFDVTDGEVTQAVLDEEITALKSDISDSTGNYYYSYVKNKYIPLDGATADVNTLLDTASNVEVCVAPCSEGDTFLITAYSGGNMTRAYGFVASDGTIISTGAGAYENLDLIAPAGSAYLVSHNRYDRQSNPQVVTNRTLVDRVDDLSAFNDLVFIDILSGASLTNSGSISATTGHMASSSWVYSDYVPIGQYHFLKVTMPTVATLNQMGMAFYDSSKTFISGVAGRETGQASYEERLIRVPDTAKYARFSFRTTENFYVKADIIGSYNWFFERADVADYGAWVSGSIDYDDTEFSASGFFRTSNKITVKKGSSLSISVGANAVFIYEYDDYGNYLPKGSAGYSKYTQDAVHTLSERTSKVRISTRTEPNNAKSTIKIVDNISVIGDVYIGQSEKHIDNNFNFFGMQMFEKIGVIGDSISCGWAKDKNGNNSRRNVGISWVQQMARRLGCTAYNLGASGVDPVEWFQTNYEFYGYCYPQYQSVGACDLYIVGLGLNQASLGTVADINQSDYTQNGATFYGQYARIIQMINAEHPNAIVMCLTEPTTAISSYDQAVRDICALSFINAELVDLENDYYDLFNTSEILAEHQPDNLHFTPYGYSLIADAMGIALNDYISKHSSKFKYVGVEIV